MENRYHLSKNYFQSPLVFEGVSVSQIGRMYCREGAVISEHRHTDLYELTVVTGGKGQVSADGVAIPVRRGDIYLTFPGDLHRIESDLDDPLKYDFIAFQPCTDRFRTELERLSYTYRSPHMRVFEEAHIGRLVSEAIAEVDGGQPLAQEVLTTLFWQILLYLVRVLEQRRPYSPRGSVTRAEELCYQIMNYIDTHIGSMQDLRELAKATGYSYGYLSALFKQTTQQTLSHYYQEKRLNAARALIMENRLRLSEIAEELGYSSAYALSKAFRAGTGMSPREYRKQENR